MKYQTAYQTYYVEEAYCFGATSVVRFVRCAELSADFRNWFPDDNLKTLLSSVMKLCVSIKISLWKKCIDFGFDPLNDLDPESGSVFNDSDISIFGCILVTVRRRAKRSLFSDSVH